MLLIVKNSSNNLTTLHRHYLTKEAKKVPFENPKMQMGGVRKLRGDAVSVVDNPESRVIAVGEGYETMLAAATAHQYTINVRSYLNAGNLAKADILRSDFDKVIIYADHDKINPRTLYRPGTHYAQVLSRRLMEMGFEVKIRLPTRECTDWADVWLEATQQLGNFIDRLVSRGIQRNSDNPFELIEEMLLNKNRNN